VALRKAVVLASGQLAELPAADDLAVTSAAIAAYATTPDPGAVGVQRWSTTELRPVVWSGTQWLPVAPLASSQGRILATARGMNMP
jgi:hypothetical protein